MYTHLQSVVRVQVYTYRTNLQGDFSAEDALAGKSRDFCTFGMSGAIAFAITIQLAFCTLNDIHIMRSLESYFHVK